MTECQLDDCTKPLKAVGYCSMHYWRLRKYGSPHTVTIIRGDTWARFWDKVDVGHPLGCWEWTGNRDYRNYGKFQQGRKSTMAHRVAYEFLIGNVPDGLVLDHLCQNPPCVNPDHLEAVTQRVNTLRGISGRRAARTHCKRGHAISGENVMRRNGGRWCRECSRASKRRYKARQRAVAS